jgi:hypothetical protein
MKWSVYPAQHNRTKTILTLSFVAAFLIFVAVFYGLFWSIFGFAVLFLSLFSYFFPTRYEVNEREVIVKNIFSTQKRSLAEFKKVYRGKNGILLSPFRRKTFLNQFRGVFLLLPSNRDEIEKYVEHCVASFGDEHAQEPEKNGTN